MPRRLIAVFKATDASLSNFWNVGGNPLSDICEQRKLNARHISVSDLFFIASPRMMLES